MCGGDDHLAWKRFIFSEACRSYELYDVLFLWWDRWARDICRNRRHSGWSCSTWGVHWWDACDEYEPDRGDSLAWTRFAIWSLRGVRHRDCWEDLDCPCSGVYRGCYNCWWFVWWPCWPSWGSVRLCGPTYFLWCSIRICLPFWRCFMTLDLWIWAFSSICLSLMISLYLHHPHPHHRYLILMMRLHSMIQMMTRLLLLIRTSLIREFHLL